MSPYMLEVVFVSVKRRDGKGRGKRARRVLFRRFLVIRIVVSIMHPPANSEETLEFILTGLSKCPSC